MAKQYNHPVVNGDVFNLHQQVPADKVAAKSSRKTVLGAGQDEQSTGDLTRDSDDEGDSAGDEPADDANDLSADQDWNASDEQRLAGLDFEDDFDDDDDDDDEEDMSGNDNVQATAGAESDDDYDGVGSDAGSIAEENDTVLLRVAAQDLRDEYESLEQELLEQEMAEIVVHPNGAASDSLNSIGVDPAQVQSLYSPYFGPQRGAILDLNEDPFAGLPSNDLLYQEMWEVAEDSMWGKPDLAQPRQGSAESASNKKRVRFQETKAEAAPSRESSVSSEEEEDPNEVFPDLFTTLEQDAAARQSMTAGDRFGIDFGDAESYYDYDEDDRLALVDDGDDSEDSDGSSTHGTEDEGDTTDEETEEEHLARLQEMRKTTTSQISSSSPTKPATPRTSSSRTRNIRRPVTPKAGKGLRLGTFALDPARAAMSVDANNRKIVVQPPTRPDAKDKEFWVRARKANSASRPSSPASSPSGWELQTPGVTRPPLTPASTLGTMFDGNLDLLRANEPPSLQPSFTPSFAPSIHASHHSSFSFNEDSDDEDDVDMEDFIDMDDYTSESDEGEPAGIISPNGDPFVSTSSTVTPTRHDSGTLNHLEQQPSLVGSFRLNQTHARHVSSLASHPAKRASTLESNALQKGRRNAANTPMTPARKNRTNQDLFMTGAGVKKSFGSPIAARRPRSRGTSLSGPGMQETLGRSLMQ